MRVILLYLFALGLGSCGLLGRVNKQKWRNSSAYRYKVVQKDSFDRQVIGKSKEQLIKLLGEPKISRDTADKYFTYCLDVNSTRYYNTALQKEVCCDCLKSFIFIDFKEGRASEVTIVTVSDYDPNKIK